MNILFVVRFPVIKDKGGVQRVTATLAEAFRFLKLNVCYLILDQGNDGVIDGIPQFFLPDGKAISLEENLAFFNDFLMNNQIDFIINQGGIYKEVIDFLSARKQQKVKLITVHHNCISCLQENFKNILRGGKYGKLIRFIDYGWFWNLLLKRNHLKYGALFQTAIQKSDKLVLLSKAFIPELGVYVSSWPMKKVTAIPNPVPFEVCQEALSHKENRLLYVGRIEYTQKQCDLLLPLWKKIQADFPDWHFDIVGGGSKLTELRDLSQNMGLQNIHFHGFSDPRPFLYRAKFLTMTSSFEGYGMVLVEAQAYGVVPVAFDSFSALGSIIEDGQTGIVVPPFEVEEYVAKITAVMRDEVKRNAMAEQAQIAVDKFMPAKIAQDWVKLFNELA
ncbi:glycosyltransferase [Flavobacterium sp.]|uniref:glycosyltransferase n=1 Tax=Flavobacterium sp. TaxID=239 RepID=UPI00391D892F